MAAILKSKMAGSKALINDFIGSAALSNMGLDPEIMTVSAILREILPITGLSRRPYWNPIWPPPGGSDFWAPPQKSNVWAYTKCIPNLVLS